MATITIRIPDATVAKLRVLARAAGKPVEQFVGEVLEAQRSGHKVLAGISGDVSERFLASGMSEEALAERLEQEGHLARGVPYQ